MNSEKGKCQRFWLRNPLTLPCSCLTGEDRASDETWAHLSPTTGEQHLMSLNAESVLLWIFVLSHLPRSQITKDSICILLCSFIHLTNVY